MTIWSPKVIFAMSGDRGQITSVTAPPAQTVPTIIEILTPELTEKVTAKGIIKAHVAQEEPMVYEIIPDITNNAAGTKNLGILRIKPTLIDY